MYVKYILYILQFLSTSDCLCVYSRSFFCPFTGDCKHQRDFCWERDPGFLPFFSAVASSPYLWLQFKKLPCVKCEAIDYSDNCTVKVRLSCSGVALFLWDWCSMKLGSGENQMVKLGGYVVRRNCLLGRCLPLCCVFASIFRCLMSVKEAGRTSLFIEGKQRQIFLLTKLKNLQEIVGYYTIGVFFLANKK